MNFPHTCCKVARYTLRAGFLFGLCLALSLGLASCAKKTAKKLKKDEPQVPPGVEVEEPSIRGAEFQAVRELKAVRFEYDRHALTEDARDVLQANADYLKEHPDLEVLAEGHCDDRGTTEYNLALGQKRAKGVRDYYGRIGVKLKRVATLSYGEEKPLCDDPTENCWAKNRRSETKVRARTAKKEEKKK